MQVKVTQSVLESRRVKNFIQL